MFSDKRIKETVNADHTFLFNYSIQQQRGINDTFIDMLSFNCDYVDCVND
jgi:hypothetical protein